MKRFVTIFLSALSIGLMGCGSTADKETTEAVTADLDAFYGSMIYAYDHYLSDTWTYSVTDVLKANATSTLWHAMINMNVVDVEGGYVSYFLEDHAMAYLFVVPRGDTEFFYGDVIYEGVKKVRKKDDVVYADVALTYVSTKKKYEEQGYYGLEPGEQVHETATVMMERENGQWRVCGLLRNGELTECPAKFVTLRDKLLRDEGDDIGVAVINDPDGFTNVREYVGYGNRTPTKMVGKLYNNQRFYFSSWSYSMNGTWIPVSYVQGDDIIRGYVHRSRICPLQAQSID